MFICIFILCDNTHRRMVVFKINREYAEIHKYRLAYTTTEHFAAYVG